MKWMVSVLNSIMYTTKGIDYFSGQECHTEEHHIFGAKNKPISESFGLKVYLSIENHREGKTAVHKNEKTAEKLHKDGQVMFEMMFDNNKKYREKAIQRNFMLVNAGGHEAFVKLFGKNYLEVENDRDSN